MPTKSKSTRKGAHTKPLTSVATKMSMSAAGEASSHLMLANEIDTVANKLATCPKGKITVLIDSNGMIGSELIEMTLRKAMIDALTKKAQWHRDQVSRLGFLTDKEEGLDGLGDLLPI